MVDKEEFKETLLHITKIHWGSADCSVADTSAWQWLGINSFNFSGILNHWNNIDN